MDKASINILVKKLAEKNEKAFQKLYLYYVDDVYAFSRSLIKSDELAKEVVQEVFIKIWLNAHQLDATSNFKSYLLTITKNDSLNLLKKAANDRKLAEKVFLKKPKLMEGPFEKLRDKELEILKQNALRCLPEKRKRVFMMSREEGKSYDEISEELGISINTVKVHMSKALSSLRKYLDTHSDIGTISLWILWISTVYI